MGNYESDYNRGAQSNEAPQKRGGGIARGIERQTARIPSDVFLWGAAAALLGSLAFQVAGPRPRRRLFGRSVEGRAPLAVFIGQWVPTLLLFGIYSKIVKGGGRGRAGAIAGPPAGLVVPRTPAATRLSGGARSPKDLFSEEARRAPGVSSLPLDQGDLI